MSTSRIDELRSKFDENPRRYFAPLANEYRKAGDLMTAIALCREHLPKQPGHMSGHIVYGQALYEANALDESRQVFEAALALDPENLIALRHLCDIAKASGDSALARRWVERMLDADPRNDEIAQQLASFFTPAAGRPAFVDAHDDAAFAVRIDNDVPDDALSAVSAEANVPDLEPPAQPTPAEGFDATMFAPVAAPDAEQQFAEHDVGSSASNDTHFARAEDDASESGAGEDGASVVGDAAQHAVADIDEDWWPAEEAVALAESVESRSTQDDDAQAIDDAFAGVPVDSFDVSDDAWPTLHTDYEVSMDVVDNARALTLADNGFVDATWQVDVPTGEHAATDPADPIDIGDALDAFGAHDPVVEIDPNEFGQPTAPADVDAPPSLAAHDYSAEFEAGIIAPEWPDTTDLFARSEQAPRATPVTPSYSQEAVSAFGRETVDHEPELIDDAIEYGERDVDAERVPEIKHVAQSLRDDSFDDVADPSVIDTNAAATIEADEAASDAVAAADTSNDADVANETAEWEAPVAVEEVGAQAQRVAEQPIDVHAEHMEADVEIDAIAEETVDAVAEATVDTVADETVDIDDSSLTSTADVEQLETFASAPEEVQEVARAMVRDARASGENEAIHIEMREGAAEDPFGPSRNVPPTPARSASAQLPPHDSPAFVTETMAELLISQGFIERAANVYDELVRRRPFDQVLVARLDELRARLAGDATADAADESDAVESEAAFDDSAQRLASSTWDDDATGDFPAQTSSPAESIASTFAAEATMPTPIIAPRAVSLDNVDSERARITARERFARLATRRVPRRTPPRAAVAIESPADGLAGLFGAADDDRAGDYAARAFADAFAPMDEPPAGASHDTPAFVSRTVTAPSAPSIATPTVSTQSAPSSAQTSSGFSFDRFFPDPATVTPVSSPTPTPASPSQSSVSAATPSPSQSQSQSPPVSDDLAEFAAWLKGLDKP